MNRRCLARGKRPSRRETGEGQSSQWVHPFSGSPIVRRKDEERWGEYRTKRLVLEAYERLGGLEQR